MVLRNPLNLPFDLRILFVVDFEMLCFLQPAQLLFNIAPRWTQPEVAAVQIDESKPDNQGGKKNARDGRMEGWKIGRLYPFE